MRASTVVVRVAIGFLLQCSTAAAAQPAWSPVGWSVARNPHFEIYSQSGAARATLTLMRFEELRSCLNETQIFNTKPRPGTKSLIRALEFATKTQYEAVQLHPTADAYYSAYADRGYIVMPIHANDDLRVPAHEYAHSVMHAAGLKLPPWLNEGLAEVFSTVAISRERCELGGPIPGHLAVLTRRSWLAGAELLVTDPTTLTSRSSEELFYAEAWAVVDTLMAAPAYTARFAQLVEMINSGTPTAVVLSRLYGKSAEQVIRDAREWIPRHGLVTRLLSRLPQEEWKVDAHPVGERQAQAMLADLLLTNGEWDRAEQIQKDLLTTSPNDPDVLASLGTIHLRKGEPREAVAYWREAIGAGLSDPELCYQFAQLAEDAGLPSAEIARALDRAVTLQPSFDDARFKLALLKSNEGDNAAAIAELQAMTSVPPGRAFGYWAALAYAFTQVDKRDEAERAAKQAQQVASNPEEYTSAVELGYQARTDLSVQFARDADGRLQARTTRVPHGAPASNPFIEAQDHIQIDSGYLQEVQCSDGKVSGFLIASTRGTVTLAVPDPTHILIKNGPSEFYCGSQTAVKVTAEYATTGASDRGLLRGLEF